MHVSRFARSGDAVLPSNSSTSIELTLLASNFSSSTAIYLTPEEIANDICLHSDHMLSTASNRKTSQVSTSLVLANDHLNLIQWLTSLKLPINAYLSNFIDNGYDNLAVCSQIGEADLDAIGVTDVEHRSRLLHAANELKHKRTEPFHRELERLFSTDLQHSKLFAVAATTTTPTRSPRCGPQEPPLMPARLKRAAQIHEYLLIQCIDLTQEHFSQKKGAAMHELAKKYACALQCSWKEVLDILEYFRCRKMEFDAKCDHKLQMTRAYESQPHRDEEVEQVIIHCDNYASSNSPAAFTNTKAFSHRVRDSTAKRTDAEQLTNLMHQNVFEDNRNRSSQNSLAYVINDFKSQLNSLPVSSHHNSVLKDYDHFNTYLSNGYNSNFSRSHEACAVQQEIYQNPMSQAQLFYSPKMNHFLAQQQQQQQLSLTSNSPLKVSWINCCPPEPLNQCAKMQASSQSNLNYYEPPLEEDEHDKVAVQLKVTREQTTTNSPKTSQWRRPSVSLSKLLHQWELQDFEACFKANGIRSIKSFHGLNCNMLREIGIVDAEHCAKILAAVESLSDEEGKLHRPTRDSGCFGSEMSSGELIENQPHYVHKHFFPATIVTTASATGSVVFNSISNSNNLTTCSKKSHIKFIKSPSKIYNMHSLMRHSSQLDGAPAEIDIKLSSTSEETCSRRAITERFNHNYQMNHTFAINQKKASPGMHDAHEGFTTMAASHYTGPQINNNSVLASPWMSPKTISTLPNYQVSKSKSPSVRSANEAFKILQTHLLNLLQADGIDLASEPYTNQIGQSGVPLRLMLRYARECNKDVRQVALAIEYARLTRVQRVGNMQPISSLTEILTDHYFTLEPLQTNNVRDFLHSLGLPMYVERLAKRGVQQLKDLLQLSDADFICLGMTQFHLQLLKEAFHNLQVQSSSTFFRQCNQRYYPQQLPQL